MRSLPSILASLGTIAAHERSGFKADLRTYAGTQILKNFGVRRIRLTTKAAKTIIATHKQNGECNHDKA